MLSVAILIFLVFISLELELIFKIIVYKIKMIKGGKEFVKSRNYKEVEELNPEFKMLGKSLRKYSFIICYKLIFYVLLIVLIKQDILG